MPHFGSPSGPYAPLLALVVGALLLLLGRRLFWLFVGVAGFLVMSSLVLRYFHVEPYLLRLLLALAGGLIGVLLAIFAQKLAVALAGFVVGGHTLAGLLGFDLAHLRPGQGLILLLGAIVAALLALWLFDLALIFFSSLAGAGLILDAAGLHGQTRLLLLVVLVVVGFLAQSRLTQPRRG
jgi:hypothetical protein